MTPEAKDTTKTEPVKIGTKGASTPAVAGSNLPTTAYDYGDDSGEGFKQQGVEHISLPLIAVLQALSPAVAKKEVEGAQEGDIYNTVTGELYGPEIFIVPCFTDRLFVEFVPRDDGGGFRGVHAPDSAVVRAVQAEARQAGRKMGKGFLVRKVTVQDNKVENRELSETFSVYGYRLDSPDAMAQGELVVVPFSSSKIPVYKDWMTRLRGVSGQPPIYAFRVKLSTVPDQNTKGQPFKNYAAAPLIGETWKDCLIPKWVSDGKVHPLFAAGQELKRQCEAGLVRATHETMEQDDRTAGDEPPLDKDGKSVF